MVSGCLFSIFVGVVCILIGIKNLSGNIAILHSYRKYKVAKHNVAPFSKIIGIGNIIIGSSAFAFGILMGVNIFLLEEIILFIGGALMVVGTFSGLALCSYGALKYNRGIFNLK